MRRVAVVGLFVVGAVTSGSVLAQSCPDGATRQTNGTPTDPAGGTGNNFNNFISGATICATRGSDRWQEFHQSGGALIDWKLGANHPIDPTKQVGTWSASNGADATVTHTYGSTSYVWAVCRVGTAAPYTYTLVSTTGGTITGATIVSGPSACP